MDQNAQKIQTVKTAPPPPELPILGRVDMQEVSFFGKTNYAAALDEKKFIFGIKKGDRRRNMYLVGKSGTGKSKLLELLIRQDIMAGRGFCVFDPHGELVTDILHFIPKERAQDVVVIDPSDIQNPISFNPLKDVEPAFRHQMAEGLIEIMEMQFGSNWKPAMEHAVRFAVLALLEYPEATLYGLMNMFLEESFRAKVLSNVRDEIIIRFWKEEYPQWLTNEKMAENIAPLINKLGQFLTDPILRSIFEQTESKVNIDRLVQEQKIILVNLAKGILGKENSSFLGMLLILKFKQVGIHRLSFPDAQRKDFYLYVDEFHHLITETFENLLFEGKKYHLPLIISHQYLGQVIEHFRGSVFGNVGTLIVFRVGGEDAGRLESELAPTFKVKDMINLGKREFYIKMMIDGEVHDPFSAETLKVLPPEHASYKDKILTASRSRYAISVRRPQQPSPPPLHERDERSE